MVETELWVRQPGDDFTQYGSFAESPIRYVAEESGLHEFYTIAGDGVGNREERTLGERSTEVPEPILITDRDGKEWDITNAALRYGMIASRWDHGVGKNTIPPVLNPRMLEQGDPGYPDDDERFTVLGVQSGEEARSYRLGDLMNREVVDDYIAGAPVAVTY